MLDPQEMKKGGFGAAAAMAWERQAARDAANQQGKSAASNPEPAEGAEGAANDPRAHRAEKTTKRPPSAAGAGSKGQ